MQKIEGKNDAYGEPSSSNSFQDKNCDESLKKEVVSSTSSSSFEDKKDGHSMQQKRYNYSHDKFDYVLEKNDNFSFSNNRKFCCTFCGGFNHVASRCWLKNKAHKKQKRQRKLSQKMLKSCTFF